MTAPILRRAAEAFREGELTWGREWFAQTDDNRCRCAGGAIAYALEPSSRDADPLFGDGDRVLGRAAMWALAAYLVDELGAADCVYPDTVVRDVIETVGAWNDTEATSVADVIAALDAAADRDEAIDAAQDRHPAGKGI